MNGCYLLPDAEFYVAIDDLGVWPTLTLFPDGSITAAVYNRPSHGLGCGDVELWASGDGGRRWERRGPISSHAENPGAVRMNHAIGLNARGELVALISGYGDGRTHAASLMPVQRCVSRDAGRTWERHEMAATCIPFGPIVCAPDGALYCSMYEKRGQRPARRTAMVFRSEDQGLAWHSVATIPIEASETALLRCRDGHWLAAARTVRPDADTDRTLPHGSGVQLLLSDDEGRTWNPTVLLSPQGQDNAQLLELADGRVLAAITSRIPGLFGVVFRVSADGGRSWSMPQPLVSIPATDWHLTDCGYPSSVQMPDGTIVTAYYYGPKEPGHGTPWHDRYHMGVARWRMDDKESQRE